MYLFPLIGAFIGFLTGSLGWLGLHILPPLVVGIFVLGFLILLSGFLHIDGLVDFGDGIMTQGPPDRKIDAMRDESVGTGGVILCFIILLTTVFSIAELGVSRIVPALITAEALAKFSIVVVATTGMSARGGLNTYFINAMRGIHGGHRFIFALIFSLGLASVFLRIIGLIMLVAAVFCALVMVAVANRNFEGVTGDVFGATNEITRMICIISVLVFSKWV